MQHLKWQHNLTGFVLWTHCIRADELLAIQYLHCPYTQLQYAVLKITNNIPKLHLSLDTDRQVNLQQIHVFKWNKRRQELTAENYMKMDTEKWTQNYIPYSLLYLGECQLQVKLEECKYWHFTIIIKI
jgi:hypothetical protein